MVNITVWCLVAAMSLLLVNRARAQSVQGGMVVRVYNSAGLARAHIASAQDAAAHIFRRAGIAVRWRECRTGSGLSAASVDSCAESVQPWELIARLVAGDAKHSRQVFGYALVDGGAQAGTLATIFTGRVADTAERLRVDAATLLGRAIAHELGHLLLGTNSHTRRGLMRAWWSDGQLRQDTALDWNFTDREAAHMTAALGARGGDMLGGAGHLVADFPFAGGANGAKTAGSGNAARGSRMERVGTGG